MEPQFEEVAIEVPDESDIPRFMPTNADIEKMALECQPDICIDPPF